MSAPLHHFRIYPGPTRHGYYFQVCIFKNRREMHKEAGMRFFKACLIGFRDKKSPKWIGDIYFNRHQMGVGLVTHELLHATFWWHRVRYKIEEVVFPDPPRKKNGTRFIDDKEEEMSLVIERLTKQFYNHCYKHEIIT